MNITIFTDGGSRGNPGDAGVGVVAFDEGQNELFSHSDYIGEKTNNEAEYQAFIASLELAEKLVVNNKVEFITWKLDSKLVVEQLNGNWKIKNFRLKKLAQKAREGLVKIKTPFKIVAVPREENTEADALVNQALDAHSLH